MTNRRSPRATTALVTGGAGFVGTNLVARLLATGHRVVLLDDLSRPGAERNLEWLRLRGSARLDVRLGSVRDAVAVRAAVEGADVVYHLAAQDSVGLSFARPKHDFRVNALGTLNVLEAIRARPEPPSLVFTSTGRVYGPLGDLALERAARRYQPADARVLESGLDERRPLDFHTPHGCSKGAADQYVLDYARCHGLHTLVLRLGSAYGPHQHGTEEQGWIAHFVRCAALAKEITIFGDGLQLRDALFVEDLVDALLLAAEHAEALAGTAFNVGGGPRQTLSPLELVDRLQRTHDVAVHHRFAAARPGDRKYYVGDSGRFTAATGWRPRVGLDEGLERLLVGIDHSRRGSA